MQRFRWIFSVGPTRVQIAAYILVATIVLKSGVAQQFDPERGILLRGTVVTMDAAGTILHNGSVLVRNGKIAAAWQGANVPNGVVVGDAALIDLGPGGEIFPGLINLHDHPTFDVLELWPTPSSHVQSALGRPLGSEPYANRYQWNMVGVTSPPEYRRLVDNPQILLNSTIGLDLYPEVGKYAELKAVLGGETAFQGGPVDPRVDNILIRNVGDVNFGRARIESRAQSIDTLTGAEMGGLLDRIRKGQVDAWIIHLAEGVRDNQRRPGDTFSSRAEFDTLISKGLLTDSTVIIQGNGLEPDDFKSMRAAASIRLDGSGDGLGAKLVWSPLSNLLLYGQTALIYHTLQAGVLVSLGTDWSPSGSRNLLDELKIADITLRDPRLLGAYRDLIPSLSITGKTEEQRIDAEIALDKLLVEMVTTNPARTLRWDSEVGSIEPGKFADLLVITRPQHPSAKDLPNSPYRNLIDATEQDVRLVLVNGEPLAGDVALMDVLKPGDYEIVTSAAGCFQKAIDVTNTAVPQGTETLAQIERALGDGLNAMGGDNPPSGGGPAANSNTYSYLKAHVAGGAAAGMTDAQFRQLLTSYFGLTTDGRLNIEGLQITPLLVEDDDFYFHLLGAEVFSSTGLIADPTPPFMLYPANFNQVQLSGDPFSAQDYRDRYFAFCSW
jgi:cytosine/adenosine deaminase-related metal-dependent hydrolase